MARKSHPCDGYETLQRAAYALRFADTGLPASPVVAWANPRTAYATARRVANRTARPVCLWWRDESGVAKLVVCTVNPPAPNRPNQKES